MYIDVITHHAVQKKKINKTTREKHLDSMFALRRLPPLSVISSGVRKDKGSILLLEEKLKQCQLKINMLVGLVRVFYQLFTFYFCHIGKCCCMKKNKLRYSEQSCTLVLLPGAGYFHTAAEVIISILYICCP